MIATRRELLQVAVASTISCAAGCPANATNKIEILTEEHALAAESASGFRKLLASQAFPGNLLILPAVRNLSLNQAHNLLRLAQSGLWVVFESGLAFARKGEHERQAGVLDQVFGLRTRSQYEPAKWQGQYVEYEWPVRQMVRPFGTPTLLDSSSGAVIGRWNGKPISKLVHAGSGGLVFLGSALGVALNSGETQASNLAISLLYSLPELKD